MIEIDSLAKQRGGAQIDPWPRVTPAPSGRALVAGLAPLTAVAILVSALLWGSGYELAPGDRLGYRVGDLRSAFSWAAAVITVVLVGYSVIGWGTAIIKGGLLWDRSRRDRRPMWHLAYPERLQKLWSDRVPAMRRQIDQALLELTVEWLRRRDGPGDVPPDEAELRRLLEPLFALSWDEDALRLPPLQPVTKNLGALAEKLEELIALAVVERQRSILQRAGPQDPFEALEAALHDTEMWWDRRQHARRHPDVAAWARFGELDIARAVGLVTGAYVWDSYEPTRLARAVAALPLRVRARYGLDLGLAWPRLVPLLPDDERTQLKRAETATDAAQLRVAGWAVAFILTAAVALFAWTDVGSGRVAVPLLLSATAAAVAILGFADYFAAVRRTLHYGSQVEASVDLHRLELLDTLGWRRPTDGEDELHVFRALSGFLAGSATSEDLLRPADHVPTAAPAELSATVDALTTLPERLERHIGSGLHRVVEDQIVRLGVTSGTAVERSLQTVESSIDRTLERHLDGPPLINYDGVLAVTIQGPTGDVEVGTDGRALVSPGHYDLRVTVCPASFAPRTPHAKATLRVRGGEARAVVPFSIGVDSNLPSARRDAVAVEIAPQALHTSDFGIDVPDDAPAESWLWVRVTQNGRTIQNARIPLAVRSDV